MTPAQHMLLGRMAGAQAEALVQRETDDDRARRVHGELADAIEDAIAILREAWTHE